MEFVITSYAGNFYLIHKVCNCQQNQGKVLYTYRKAMPIKTQTKISLIFIGASALGLFLFYYFNSVTTQTTSAAEEQITPQVLGVQTKNLRGIPLTTLPASPRQFTLNTPLDTRLVNAKSYFVYDAHTGQILAEKNKELPIPIASITKLMTASLVYTYLPLDEPLIVEPRDTISVTPVLRLRVGDSVLPSDLLKAIFVGSANDAAKMLANHLEKVTGKPIEQLMNEQAATLSMQRSHFDNPMGFDSFSNYSTAADIRLLLNSVFVRESFTDIGHLTAYSFTSSGKRSYSIKATNKLVAKDPNLLAIKTGYTDVALGAMVTKFNFGGRDICIIVLGSTNREGDTVALKKAVTQSYGLEK
jgi:D-alanyl-D-alanine carboxypeptidase